MYKEKIINANTNEISFRDYTEQEIAEVEKAQANAAAKVKESNDKAEQRAALLERLGITEEEANLLLG